MRQAARLLIAALLGVAASPVFAGDDAAAAWNAAQQASARAQSAEEALSERYTSIWSTLDATQKSRFSAQERAWLNEGREQEQRACIARVGAHTDLAVRTCEADVLERHLGALRAPQRVASSS